MLENLFVLQLFRVGTNSWEVVYYKEIMSNNDKQRVCSNNEYLHHSRNLVSSVFKNNILASLDPPRFPYTLLCRQRSIAAHRDNFVQRLSVRLSVW